MSTNYVPAVEWPKIQQFALHYGVDPFLIQAIRRAENGGPGDEFGVESVKATTYEDQLRICCVTVMHQHQRYMIAESRSPVEVSSFTLALDGALGATPPAAITLSRVVYTRGFLKSLQETYCPVGAGDDLKGLNVNWFTNVTNFYFDTLKEFLLKDKL